MSQDEPSARVRRPRIATQRMSVQVQDKALRVQFAGGAVKTWPLASQQDKNNIREVRDAAMQFARENGATVGQQNAVRKGLAKAGYYLTK